MTPKEKKEAANKVLDDTMTVSQAKQRKLDLRAKDLDIRAVHPDKMEEWAEHLVRKLKDETI